MKFRVIFSVEDKLLAKYFRDDGLAKVYADAVLGYVQVLNPVLGWVDLVY